jgi:myosin heavy subunit
LFATDVEQKWKLGHLDSYNFLKHSGTTTADGIDDSKDFATVRKAMKVH